MGGVDRGGRSHLVNWNVVSKSGLWIGNFEAKVYPLEVVVVPVRTFRLYGVSSLQVSRELYSNG